MHETGLAASFGNVLTRLPGASSLWGLTLWCIFTATFLTELTSNTAAISISPTSHRHRRHGQCEPHTSALGSNIGMFSAFMLPVATPPNAIVYSSGIVPIGQMVKTGALLNLVTGLAVWLLLRLLCPALGMTVG